MRLRISACGAVFAVDGQVVWDDYLDQRQVVLGSECGEVMHWFVRWRDRDSVPERHRAAVEALLADDILVAEGSQRDAQEQAVLHAWSDWGPVARAYHYATRTTRGSRFPAIEPTAPEPASTVPDAVRIPLPSAEEAQWRHRDLLDVFQLRRGGREFGREPVPVAALGALLQISARHAIELYAVVRDVEGLKAAVYHYDRRTHELAVVGDSVCDRDLIAACGDQAWMTAAGLVVFYTSVFGRNAWQPEARSYRMLQLEAGQVNETLSLAATALGLRTTFTAAIRDELVEELIGCDPATELAIGCAAVGTA